MAHVMHPRGSMSIELNGLLKASRHLFCLVPGAGFEPAKLYAEDLESTPFDRSGTPACTQRSNPLFLTIALQQGHQDLWGAAVEGFGQAWPCRLVGG